MPRVRSARNRDPGEKFLSHARQRTNFRYAVTVAVAARADIEIAYWYKDGSVKIPITYQTDDGTIVEDTVIPDDFLGIRWLQSGIVEPLPVEADKRKDYPRVRKKLIARVCASVAADQSRDCEAAACPPAYAAGVASHGSGTLPKAGVYHCWTAGVEFPRAVGSEGCRAQGGVAAACP